MKLKELAGWNQTTADWERFLNSSPQGCFVAESEGQVCGTVTTIIYEGRFAWVGMVLVAPEHRGKGIGTQLLNRTIEYLDASSVATIKLDATPKGKPIYEKLGFVTEYEIDRWALSSHSPKPDSTFALPIGDSGSQNEVLKLDEILKVDRDAFGADRNALLRSLHRDAPEFTAALYHEGSLAGYTLGRRGSRADHLGPWMARNEPAAHQLLAAFLTRSTHEIIFVDCLKSSPFASRLVQSAGFEISRPLTRMVRGANTFAGRPELFCAILGPEFG
jgi:predicted N-acetyltransferase YhbS